MKILLVSATKFEVFPLGHRLSKVRGKDHVWNYKTSKHSVDLLVTGVGMTATAYELGRTLSGKYDLAVNIGVAGSFRKKIALGSVVSVKSDRFADMGAEDGNRFLTLEEMGLSNGSWKLEDESWKDKKALSGLKKVKGITVNTVHGNSASIKKVMKKFNPDIETMEGAAFFYACDRMGIPCLQIRAISNYVERRNKKNWQLNLAIRNLSHGLLPHR